MLLLIVLVVAVFAVALILQAQVHRRFRWVARRERVEDERAARTPDELLANTLWRLLRDREFGVAIALSLERQGLETADELIRALQRRPPVLEVVA